MAFDRMSKKIVAAALAAIASALLGCESKPATTGVSVAKPVAAASTSGCQASLPTASSDADVMNAGLTEVRLVESNPTLWGLQLPEGTPLVLDGSVEVPPLHANVRRRFDPHLTANGPSDVLVYVIFPRNDFTVKPPTTGWHHEPDSAMTDVYCRDFRETQPSSGGPDDVFWLTPLDTRGYSVQWQIVRTGSGAPVASRIHGFPFKVTF